MPISATALARRSGLLRVAALLALLLLLGWLTWGMRQAYQARELRYHAVIESGLEAINQLRARSVADWLRRRQSDAEALSGDRALAALLARWQARPMPEQEALLRERLAGLVEHWGYARAYITDSQGRLLLGPDGPLSGRLPEPEREALLQGLASFGASSNMGLQRGGRFEFVHYDLLAPLFDGQRAVGAIWLVMDARSTLFPLLQAGLDGGPSSVESMLVQRQGGELLYLSPLRHRPDAPLTRRLPLQPGSPVAVVRALLGEHGPLYGQDYRGQPVLTQAQAVAGSDWLLVTEIDTNEIFAEAEQSGWLSLTLFASLTLFLLGAMVLLWQWRGWRRERALKERLQDNMRWLETAQRAASIGYFAYDLQRRVFAMSPMANRIFGLPELGEMALKQWAGLIHPEDRQAMLQVHGQAMEAHSALRVQYRIQPQDGGPQRWVEVRAEFGIGDPDGVSRMTGTVQDVTERHQAEEQLERYRAALEAQVRIDPLTQQANRLALDECVANEWQRSVRAGTPLGLLMIDVDRFKAYNDHYGHVAGDHCLQRVAQALALASGRAGDLVARFGGEEFAVLLPGAGLEQAWATAERLRLAVRGLQLEHALGAASEGIVTISVGVASVLPAHVESAAPGTGMAAGAAPGTVPVAGMQAGTQAGTQAGIGRAQELFRRADAALYRAKASGRDRCQRYDRDCDQQLHSPAPG